MEWLTWSPVPKFTRLAFYRTYFGTLAAFPSIHPLILHFNIQSKWINSSSITSSVFPSEPSFLDCELLENRSCIIHSKYLLPHSTSIIVLGTHRCVVNIGRMNEYWGLTPHTVHLFHFSHKNSYLNVLSLIFTHKEMVGVCGLRGIVQESLASVIRMTRRPLPLC